MNHLAAIVLVMLTSSAALAGDVSGAVTLNGRPLADAVVYLEGQETQFPEPTPVSMDQRNLSFIPKVLPVMRGTTVQFTNSDDIQHNVFSPASGSSPFDLGTYGPGDVSSVKLDRAGDLVVLCNIHMEMHARIVVLPQPYFARTSSDGRYRVAAVPAGTYTVKLWNGRFLKNTTSLVVPATGDVSNDVHAGE